MYHINDDDMHINDDDYDTQYDTAGLTCFVNKGHKS